MLTVNTQSADQAVSDEEHGAARRRTDFEALAEALGAEILDWSAVDRGIAGRMLRAKLGFGPVAAVMLFARRKRYDVIWCFSEIEGLLLAFFFKVFRVRRVLFLIGIETLSPKSLFLLGKLRVWTHFTAILPTNSHQASELQRVTRIPADKVIVLPYQVDCAFYSGHPQPETGREGRYVVAVGGDSRDYATLVEAVRGLDVEVIIVAASPWTKRAVFPLGSALPPNVTIASSGAASMSDTALRRLYGGAAVAVVPLHESPYQKGVTALQEAMAMGLPVIVTRTVGQSDVVIDRRSVLRGNPALGTRGGFAYSLAPNRPDLQRSNGFYVGVGDAAALRQSIRYLLREGTVAASLGRQAERFVREVLSLERFAERSVRLVLVAWSGRGIYPGIFSDGIADLDSDGDAAKRSGRC